MSIFSSSKKNQSEPLIITLDEPIHAVGMGVKTSIKTVFKDIPPLGGKYKAYKEKYGIPNRKEPWSFLAVSKNYCPETKTWEYIMGDVVTGQEPVPAALTVFSVPPGMYAVFTIRPRFSFLWGLAIAKMKKYIYETWLPQSSYVQTGIDFEYHDERSTRKKQPEIDLYVAIQQK